MTNRKVQSTAPENEAEASASAPKHKLPKQTSASIYRGSRFILSFSDTQKEKLDRSLERTVATVYRRVGLYRLIFQKEVMIAFKQNVQLRDSGSYSSSDMARSHECTVSSHSHQQLCSYVINFLCELCHSASYVAWSLFAPFILGIEILYNSASCTQSILI
jgi:hypothetical protein